MMPTSDYLDRVCFQFEILDELPRWQVELVWEYGYDRVLRAVREHYTPARARAFLERDRQQRECARWRL